MASDAEDKPDDPRACGEDEDEEPRLAGPYPRPSCIAIVVSPITRGGPSSSAEPEDDWFDWQDEDEDDDDPLARYPRDARMDADEEGRQIG
jgi:hypothetical protein